MKTALLAASLVLCSSALAPAAGRWQLDLQPGRAGTVIATGAAGAGTYLYLTLVVSNPGDQDAPLRLGLQADTDVPGRVYRGSFDAAVHRAVERRLGRKLATLNEIRGPLSPGESRECLVTFGRVDPNVDEFRIRVSGLVDRVFRDRDRWWVEDRVLVLTYRRPGDEFRRQNDLLRLLRRTWTREGDGPTELPRK